MSSIDWSNTNQVNMLFSTSRDLMRAAFANPSYKPTDFTDDDLTRLSNICLSGAEALLIALYTRDNQDTGNDHDVPSAH